MVKIKFNFETLSFSNYPNYVTDIQKISILETKTKNCYANLTRS